MFLISVLFCCGNVAANNSQVLIKLTNKGDFDIFFHRSQTTTTAAVLGGLIGAGIETGVSKSKDSNLENDLIEQTGEIICHEDLIHAFKQKLTADDKFSVVQEEALSENSNHLTLILSIKDCGYKLTNQENNMLSAFVSFKAKIKQSKSTTINFDESFMIKSSQHHHLNDLLINADTVTKEMHDLLEKAGKRLANKIIYFK